MSACLRISIFGTAETVPALAQQPARKILLKKIAGNRKLDFILIPLNQFTSRRRIANGERALIVVERRNDDFIDFGIAFIRFQTVRKRTSHFSGRRIVKTSSLSRCKNSMGFDFVSGIAVTDLVQFHDSFCCLPVLVFLRPRNFD